MDDVAVRETFGQICRRVCEEQGWELMPSGVRLVFGDGRHQVVSLEFFEYEREELVRLLTTIGPAGQLGAERLLHALEGNARLAHGALAVHAGQLMMVDTLMLKDADPSEVEASISYLAETADRYEKILFHTDEN